MAMQIGGRPDEEFRQLILRASHYHPWDAMAPAALEAIAARGPFRASAETGCGGSTIVLSRLSPHHTVFAIEGENNTISNLKRHPDLESANAHFVEGETSASLPNRVLPFPLQFVLLDGPHAYPLPQLEFEYLFPCLDIGGWIALDDIQIPSVHELYRFLRSEPCVAFEDVVVRTAFFQKQSAHRNGPDGWQDQRSNRHPILRYSWRDRLRDWLKPAIH